MALKAVKVSAFLNETGLQAELSEIQTQLANIDAQINSFEAQIAALKRKKEAIKANIADTETLLEIVNRLKLRETEGIK